MNSNSDSPWYVHHLVTVRPRCWFGVAQALLACFGVRRDSNAGTADDSLCEEDQPGPMGAQRLYGIWRSQIGMPRDVLNVITFWPAGSEPDENALCLARCAAKINPDILGCQSLIMQPTLRPSQTNRPIRQGNFAFRWFLTPQIHWPEFLALCESAWPGFESAYDSQVIGLWRVDSSLPGMNEVERLPGEPVLPKGSSADAGSPPMVRSLLLTRRPNLAMWERSKIPNGATETAVRQKLSRRYDLCDATWVYTTTLLSAQDHQDDARWT